MLVICLVESCNGLELLGLLCRVHKYICLMSRQVIVYEGKPSIDCIANAPQSLLSGMNLFLSNLDITFRRDPTNYRPRINKLDSTKDREQKSGGTYYYLLGSGSIGSIPGIGDDDGEGDDEGEREGDCDGDGDRDGDDNGEGDDDGDGDRDGVGDASGA